MMTQPVCISGAGSGIGRQAALKDETLVRRNGTPDDIASTILWLCSPGARHITGQSIQVNGGARLG